MRWAGPARWPRSRSLSWFDVLVELVAFALLCVGLVFFLGPAVEWAAAPVGDRADAGRALVRRRDRGAVPARAAGTGAGARRLVPRRQHALQAGVLDPLAAPAHVGAGRSGGGPRVHVAAAEPAGHAVAAGRGAARRTGRAARLRPVDALVDRRPPARGAARRDWLHQHLESLGHQCGILALSLVQLVFSVWQLVVIAGVRRWRRPSCCGAGPSRTRCAARPETGPACGSAGRTCRRPACRCPARTGSTRSASSCTKSRSGRSSTRGSGGSSRDRATWRDFVGSGLIPLVSLVADPADGGAARLGLVGLLTLWVWRPFVSSPVRVVPAARGVDAPRRAPCRRRCAGAARPRPGADDVAGPAAGPVRAGLAGADRGVPARPARRTAEADALRTSRSRRRRSCGGSNATCTTGSSRGWSRWA